MDAITIRLSQGQVTIIDAHNHDLALLGWYAQRDSKNQSVYYAYRKTRAVDGKRSSQLLHRVVLSRKLDRQLLRSEHVDHINHNTLDNRESNLRLATRQQSQMNRRRHSNSKSGYKGVMYNDVMQNWIAVIRADNKRHYLGWFKTPEEAARAYDTAAVRLHGEFANLNFPTNPDGG